MTCTCNASLIRSWTAPDMRPCAAFALKDQQFVLIGQEFVVKGYCRCCRLYHAIPNPGAVLEAFLPPLRIPVTRIGALAVAVKIRR